MSFQEFGTFGDQFCNVDVRHLFAFRPEADRSVFLLVLYAVIRQYRGKVPSIVSDTFKVLPDVSDAIPPNNRCFIGSTLLTEETAATGEYANQPPPRCTVMTGPINSHHRG